MTNKKAEKIKLNPDILIAEMIEAYPIIANHLVVEYGIHCVGCFASQFDTLREGAKIHGITDQYFDELVADLEAVINDSYSSLE